MARLPAQEKVERDRLIVADRAAGLTWPTIARRHDISERQGRRAARSHWEGASGLAEHDPVEAVLEALEQVDVIVERFARLAAEATHDAVVVGASQLWDRVMPETRDVLAVLTRRPTEELTLDQLSAQSGGQRGGGDAVAPNPAP
jgi:hypothetical protein